MEKSTTQPQQAQKTLVVMAQRLGVEPAKLHSTLKATVFRGATDEEFFTLMVVANQHQLNPMLRQIYAFPNKKGGIVPVVSVDGWIAIVNSKKNFDGCDFEYGDRDGKPEWCKCTMHVKRRSHPVVVTEYYDECFRDSEPWRQMPRRMLRHKAYMQCARVAFGLSGIFDEDEAKDIAVQATVTHEEHVPPEFVLPVKENIKKFEPKKVEDSDPQPPRRRRVVREAEVEPSQEPAAPQGELTSPVKELTRLMTESEVSEDQVLVFAAESFGVQAATMENLGDVIVLKLVTGWSQNLSTIKDIVV